MYVLVLEFQNHASASVNHNGNGCGQSDITSFLLPSFSSCRTMNWEWCWGDNVIDMLIILASHCECHGQNEHVVLGTKLTMWTIAWVKGVYSVQLILLICLVLQVCTQHHVKNIVLFVHSPDRAILPVLKMCWYMSLDLTWTGCASLLEEEPLHGPWPRQQLMLKSRIVVS